MKKREIIITLLLVLVFACTVSLSACGLADFDSNATQDENSHSGDRADDGGKDSNGGTGNVTTSTDELRSESAIKAALGDNYCVTVHVLFGGEMDNADFTLGQYDDYMYNQTSDGSEMLISMMDNGSYGYTTDDNGNFASMVRYTEEIDFYSYLVALFMYTDSIEYTSKGSASIAGRSCTHYSNTYEGAAIGVFYNEEVYIDNQTGACLKHTIDYEGNSIRTAQVSFECTRFLIGSEVSAYFADILSRITISPWDTDFMSAMGLGGVEAPDGVLLVADLRRDGGSLRGDDGYWVWGASYTMDVSLAAFDAAVEALARAFYDAGAKRGYDDPSPQSFANLYRADGRQFAASIDAIGDSVSVQGYYSSTDGGTIVIELTDYNWDNSRFNQGQARVQ